MGAGINVCGFSRKGFPMRHHGRFSVTVCKRDQSVSFIYPSQHGVQVGTFVLDHKYRSWIPTEQAEKVKRVLVCCHLSNLIG